MARRFLTAAWRNLVMLNYEVAPDVLRPLVPHGTELDAWQGRCFLSLVGFQFQDTRVLGVPVPFHRSFEEVNLRFYVGRQAEDGWRRGVVFVREVVPRWAVAAVARLVYQENYVACRMGSDVRLPDPAGQPGRVEYRWGGPPRWHTLRADFAGEPAPPARGSEEEFITEHYWGYAAQRDGSAVEYQVGHPPWRVWRATTASFDGDAAAFYGPQYADALARPPSSAFVAEGSPVVVYRGRRLV